MQIYNEFNRVVVGGREIPVDKLVLFFDVDGCLTETNQHHLSDVQNAILRSIMTETNYNTFLFTDNDGRLISEMAPYMPVISEGGAVIRRDDKKNILSPDVDIDTISEIAQAIANREGINFFVGHSNESQKSTERMVFELKEASFGINCGHDEHHKSRTARIAHDIKNDPRFPLTSQFSIITSGADNVEIRSAGFSKGKQFKNVMNYLGISGQTPLMFGNSNSDYPVMKQAHEMGGGGIATTNDIAPCDSILLRAASIDQNWKIISQLNDAILAAKYHQQTTRAPQARHARVG